MRGWSPPEGVHAVLWLPLTLVLALAILPVVKGALIGLQWALRMGGFAEAQRGVDKSGPRPEVT